METFAIQKPNDLGQRLVAETHNGQLEAGRCWTEFTAFHAAARQKREKWPSRDDLQKVTKGKHRPHSQIVQMICHHLLADVNATLERWGSEPASQRWLLRCPYKGKCFYALYGAAQAVSYDPTRRRLMLSMGRDRKSLVFKLDLDLTAGSVKLVWKEGIDRTSCAPTWLSWQPPAPTAPP
jgi:hypothetical protein